MGIAKVDGASVATTLARAVTSSDTPRLEAELLLAHVLGLSRAALYTHPEYLLTPSQLSAFGKLLERRTAGEPLPYLTGQVEFYGLDLRVDSRVLIPRPETETLVELALDWIDQVADLVTVADVGTGSGCIAVALAAHAPRAELLALDRSTDALDVARCNAVRHSVLDRVTLVPSDLLTALPTRVDLVVANLPYIADKEWSTLSREVREYEPTLALQGGRRGLAVIQRLLEAAPRHLTPGGAVLLEIGAAQGSDAVQLARQSFPRAQISLHTDLAGRDRVLRVQTYRPTTREPHPGK